MNKTTFSIVQNAAPFRRNGCNVSRMVQWWIKQFRQLGGWWTKWLWMVGRHNSNSLAIAVHLCCLANTANVCQPLLTCSIAPWIVSFHSRFDLITEQNGTEVSVELSNLSIKTEQTEREVSATYIVTHCIKERTAYCNAWLSGCCHWPLAFCQATSQQAVHTFSHEPLTSEPVFCRGKLRMSDMSLSHLLLLQGQVTLAHHRRPIATYIPLRGHSEGWELGKWKIHLYLWDVHLREMASMDRLKQYEERDLPNVTVGDIRYYQKWKKIWLQSQLNL